jgi:hypothetical protein
MKIYINILTLEDASRIAAILKQNNVVYSQYEKGNRVETKELELRYEYIRLTGRRFRLTIKERELIAKKKITKEKLLIKAIKELKA